MKKIILAAALILGFAVAASAQPKAIGIRIGNGGEISYQHSMGGNFIEVDGGFGLGLNGRTNIMAAGIYNFLIAQPSWTDRGEWGFYAGPGAGLGVGFGEKGYFHLSAAGMVGLEYTFEIPLQISVDFRQHIGIGFGHGLWTPSSIGIGVRYHF